MIVAMFPGQGSLSPGVGALWADHPSAKIFDVIGEIADVDVRHLLISAQNDELIRTDNAQLATFALSTVIAHAATTHGWRADLAIGHSLGEYSALCFAGVLSLADATRLVVARGRAMAEASLVDPGSMAAVLGVDDQVLDAALRALPGLVVANLNAPGQRVVSGGRAEIAQLVASPRDFGLRKVIELSVGGAFHSPLMRPAEPGLAAALSHAAFAPGQMPVVANVDAQSPQDPAEWPELLVRQLTAPVQFEASIRSVISPSTFVELGPGGVLCGLVKRITREASPMSVATPEDIASLEVRDG